jgi:hypothetical protein
MTNDFVLSCEFQKRTPKTSIPDDAPYNHTATSYATMATQTNAWILGIGTSNWSLRAK